MKAQSSKTITHRWRTVADAMPQLICLIDGDGRVLHANRTLERWRLGEGKCVQRVALHELLHARCSNPDCYLRAFWQRSVSALARGQHAEHEVWDAVLQKHLQIRVQLPLQDTEPDAAAEDSFHFFAVITIDDVSARKASEGVSRQAEQVLSEHAQIEEQKRVQAEKMQSHLFTLLDKAPSLTAMADRGGALFYLNPAGRALMGLRSDDELTGLTLIECQASGERAHVTEKALSAAERDGVWSEDSVLLSRDGREFRTYLTLAAHRDEQGHLEGFSLHGRDMSEWVRMEEALRATQNELWRLSAQHLTIQESERRRIAADLHDGLGQTLSLVKLSIEQAARAASEEAAGTVAAALERLAPTVKSALAELRRIAMNLRPSTLDDLGILATLSWCFREFEAACANIRLEREIGAAETDVPNLLKISIFRIVQEATSNALKHAGAKRIQVCLDKRDGTLELSIEDDGRGFDPAAAAVDLSHGLGLQSMKERAELSGGDYELRSALGEGVRIRVRWPTRETAASDLAAPALSSTVQLLRLPGAVDRELAEQYSACLACMRNQRSQ